MAIPARVALGSTLVTAPNSARTARGPPCALNGGRAGAGNGAGEAEGALGGTLGVEDTGVCPGRGSGSLLGARVQAQTETARTVSASRTWAAYTRPQKTR